MTTVKERPILMSAPMVRAILAGAKTQTRRVIKPQPISNAFGPPDPVYDIPCHCDYYPPSAMLWPDENGGILNGDAGHPWLGVERLWVRETFTKGDGEGPEFAYLADGWTLQPGEKWRPSIFMPRAASRITLEITDVRGERVQDITPDDCRAEGMPKDNTDTGVRYCYGQLWNELNEGRGYGWDANPFVWVITFRRVEP